MTIRSALGTVVVTAVILAGGSALAGNDPWGTPDDAQKCAKETDANAPEFVRGGWYTWKDDQPVEPENASADCKAEVGKRADACLQDAAMQAQIKKATNPKPNEKGGYIQTMKKLGDKGPRVICLGEAWLRVTLQLKYAAADKKAADARKANADKAEVPKPSKKDATIEGMVKTTYAKAFPAAKVLSVVIVSNDWSTERNDLGTVIGRNIQVAVVNQQKDECEIYSELWNQEYIGGAFKGPLTERGAGSLTRTPITCSKVPGAKK